jgi:hypothetical protein
MPVNIRMARDYSEFYIKSPEEMSRHEIADLEHELRLINEPNLDGV